MAKIKLKNDDKNYFLEGLENNLPLEQNIADNVETNMHMYGNKVIRDRAIPDFRDGLKPVHRRILYSMYKGNYISNGKDFWKSARIVGDTMGQYHPHGDKAIYDAAVNLLVDWKNNYPLIKGKGDFGNIDGDKAAAMRYSEMRISTKTAEMLFENLDKKNKNGEYIINMTPNYDRKQLEPSFLSVKLPFMLLNGTQGIAYTMSTNIPSYNKNELIDGFSRMISEKFWEGNFDKELLLEHIKGPDFPTGCDVYEVKEGEMKDFIFNPYGKIGMRAKIKVDDEKKEVIITNVPYNVNTSKLYENILNLYKNFLEFKNSKEKYTKPYLSLESMPFNGTKIDTPEIILNFNKDCNLNIEINKLYKYVKYMDVLFNQQFRILDKNKKVLTIGLPEYMKLFLEFRKDMNVKRVKVELEKHYEDLNIQEGIYLAISNIEKIQKILKEASDKNRKENMEEKEIEDWVLNQFQTEIGMNKEQSIYVSEMKLIKLSSLKVKNQEDKINNIKNIINDKEDFIASDYRIYNFIKDEMIEFKDNEERKSKVIIHNRNISEEDLIEEQENMIVYTLDERIYKTPIDNFKTQNKGTRGKKLSSKEDIIDKAINASSLDLIGMVTNKGRMFLLKSYMLPTDKSYVKNFFNMEPEEKLIEMIKISKEEFNNKDTYIVFTTNNGLVKRTKMEEYSSMNGKGNRGIKAITLNENDDVNSVFIGNKDEDMIIVSNNNKAIRFNIEQIPFTSRSSKGVIGMRMGEGKVLTSVKIENPEMVMTLFTENGNGKKFSVSTIRKINRGGKGVNVFNEERNDTKMIDVVITEDNDEIILISKNGIINKINSNTINEKRKQATMANKIMDIDENDTLIKVLVIKNNEIIAEDFEEEEI